MKTYIVSSGGQTIHAQAEDIHEAGAILILKGLGQIMQAREEGEEESQSKFFLTRKALERAAEIMRGLEIKK